LDERAAFQRQNYTCATETVIVSETGKSFISGGEIKGLGSVMTNRYIRGCLPDAEVQETEDCCGCGWRWVDGVG
jgi:hypothetical protein